MWGLNQAQLLAILLLSIIGVSLTTNTTTTTTSTTIEDTYNYNCPEHCKCVIPLHALDRPAHFLHAKCSSVDGILEAEVLKPDYPIHSIDLSFLNLQNVSALVRKLPNITSINLSHNQLHGFGHLGRNMKRLNLKNNRITSSKLSKLPHYVQTLNLQSNDITYLPREMTQLTFLTHLDLSKNDINCSCDTLYVRNWLQEQNVFMENAVICALPAKARGMSWLQVKQDDICQDEKSWHLGVDEENELMLGDQPIEGLSDHDEQEELDKIYIRVPVKKQTKRQTIDDSLNEVEGSGDLSVPNMELHESLTTEKSSDVSTPTVSVVTDNDEEDLYDASGDDGSGDGVFDLFTSRHLIDLDGENNATGVYVEPGTVEAGFKDSLPLEEPDLNATISPNIFEKSNLNIFRDSEEPLDSSSVPTDTIEQKVVASTEGVENVARVLTPGPNDDEEEENEENEAEAIKHAEVPNKEDSKATYFLLGALVLLVVGLLLFVAIKRCNRKRRDYDPENLPQTELLDMDKKNLGKPIQRNGVESSPLIGEKTKIDQAKPINGTTKPYDSGDVKDGAGQQLLPENGNHQPNATAATNEPPTHEYHPITPRYPTPKSPRASKYAQYGENNNNPNQSDAYLPSSPKSGRYSPVYSPETGRVKIKLTETPKPKTPMFVTRSRSNAGDIVTSPIVPRTHLPPVTPNNNTNNGVATQH